MKKVLIFVLVFLAIAAAIMLIPNSEQKNVLYGERESVFKPSKNTSRLFFDKMGNLYPAGEIPNSKLLKNKASIKTYYKNNPKKFKAIAAAYKLEAGSYSDENFTALQDAIIAGKVKEINELRPEYSNVFILIHGFSKPIASHNSTTSSYVDNIIIKSAISDQTVTKNYFIEVYWDGLYDFFEPTKTNQQEETFKLFETEARTNAVFTGYGLRKIITNLEADRISMVAHSLGARVVLSCLINAYDDLANEVLQTMRTPAQNTIDICLIAPAIGNKPFEAYYDRTTNLIFQEKDNYNLYILYNEEDFVLLKKWNFVGPGPKAFGDTSLGCNYEDAALKLKARFAEQYPHSNISLLKTAIGKTHLVEHYVHSNSFSRFLTGDVFAE